LDPSENTRLPVPFPAVSEAFNAFETKIIRPVFSEAVGRFAKRNAVEVKPLFEITGPKK